MTISKETSHKLAIYIHSTNDFWLWLASNGIHNLDQHQVVTNVDRIKPLILHPLSYYQEIDWFVCFLFNTITSPTKQHEDYFGWIKIYLYEKILITMYWKMHIYFQKIEIILNFYEICNIYFTYDNT
jgi:hypothetical protein